eukprot:TRINITY_DN2640_c0_g1_i2.p1 TRINITY_DN2640_c0_g1~~TRINITY_DN2640_c0_g1_i2.p1  ORF type:complete len:358 (-),score=71.14 TRINITY_DN2640_c0_g1_i2:160-1233(-)
MEDNVEGISASIERLSMIAVTPPKNWPPSLRYTTSNLWDDIPSDFRAKFEDAVLITPLVKVDVDPDMNQYRVLTTNAFAEGVWLGEYTGEVLRVDQLDDAAYAVLLHENKATKEVYVVDASTRGNELRYLRRANPEDANCKYFRFMVDGLWRCFLQITREITAENVELLLEDEPALVLPNGRTLTEFEEQTRAAQYEYAYNLSYDNLSEKDREYLTTRRNLSELCRLGRINSPNHPCNGEIGVFSNSFIANGTYVGEYTGKVLTHVEEPFSRYLVDFSNPHSEGCDKVWSDALLDGNEMRYINDFMNTGHECNVNFRKMFLDGIMRVYVQATADIQPDEEFLVDYGSGYWDNMPKHE